MSEKLELIKATVRNGATIPKFEKGFGLEGYNIGKITLRNEDGTEKTMLIEKEELDEVSTYYKEYLLSRE